MERFTGYVNRALSTKHQNTLYQVSISVNSSSSKKEVTVTTPISIYFNEAVKYDHVEQPFTLIDETSGEELQIDIEAQYEQGWMKIVLYPIHNLSFSSSYRVEIDGTITDAIKNSDGELHPLTGGDTSISFTTKKPKLYTLGDGQFERGMSIRTIDVGDKRYAFIGARRSGFYIINITDPKKPVFAGHSSVLHVNDLDFNEERNWIAILNRSKSILGGGSLYMEELLPGTEHELEFNYIGRHTTGYDSTGTPIRIATEGDVAYVTTGYGTIQVIDLVAVASGGKNATIGYFASSEKGYGNAKELNAYRPGRLLTSTSTRNYILLNTSTPGYPHETFVSEDSNNLLVFAERDYSYIKDNVETTIDLIATWRHHGTYASIEFVDITNRIFARSDTC